MPNPSLLFESARKAAETLTDPRAKSQLLSELAQSQLATKQFDAALQTFADIPDPMERRVALLVADFQSFPVEKIETLAELLEIHPQTNHLAGRLALAMLEANNTASAWKLIDTADEPFESDQQQYDFLEKLLPHVQAEDWNRTLRFYRSFIPGMYRDWASLALIKYLASQRRFEEAERIADSLTLPLRYSWAFWEMSRLSPEEQRKHYFDKAVEIAEKVEITDTDEEIMEILAVQLRIFGRVAFEKGEKDQGIRLLERSEAAAATMTLPVQRYRLQSFLGRALVELKQIESIKDYLPIETMLESLRTASDRSRVSVWLAEAGWSEGWVRAMELLSVPERGIPEAERAEQIAEVLKRCTAHQRDLKATGDSAEDAVRLSGEEFETLYFNPFAEADCGCY